MALTLFEIAEIFEKASDSSSVDIDATNYSKRELQGFLSMVGKIIYENGSHNQTTITLRNLSKIEMDDILFVLKYRENNNYLGHFSIRLDFC